MSARASVTTDLTEWDRLELAKWTYTHTTDDTARAKALNIIRAALDAAPREAT
jgi:hypothetical protein